METVEIQQPAKVLLDKDNERIRQDMKLTRLSAHPTILELLPGYERMEGFLLSLPSLFQQEKGQLIHDGRNQLRVLEFEGENMWSKPIGSPSLSIG